MNITHPRQATLFLAALALLCSACTATTAAAEENAVQKVSTGNTELNIQMNDTDGQPIVTTEYATLRFRHKDVMNSYKIEFEPSVSAECAELFFTSVIKSCLEREGKRPFIVSYRMSKTPNWNECYINHFKRSKWYSSKRDYDGKKASRLKGVDESYREFIQEILAKRGIQLDEKTTKFSLGDMIFIGEHIDGVYADVCIYFNHDKLVELLK